jgi:hypothetical protein
LDVDGFDLDYAVWACNFCNALGTVKLMEL